MLRHLGIALCLLLLHGCRPSPASTSVSISGGSKIHWLQIESEFAYVIDPRVQSCFLLFGDSDKAAMTPIDCQKLRASVPEAAKVITWGAAAPAAD